MFDNIIENEKDNIINTLCELMKFKSVSVETNNPDIPFGEQCKKALEYVLDFAKSLGFRTKNIDGYCGYIECGSGEELVGIIGHLDVVPAHYEDGWDSDPFSPEIRNNKIYGRGAIDDKGPVIASLYAMKTVLESGKKLNKRVRLILGLNEETKWKCIKHYKNVGEEIPTIGFSPDADFPTIYAEKGILSLDLSTFLTIPNIEIIEFDCNNNALNVVPKYCSVTLKINNSESINFKNAKNISVEKLEDSTFKIISTGISAHAAHPDLGQNAITNLICYLNSCFSINLFEKYQKLGIFDIYSPSFLSSEPIQDESGILTSNIGFISYKDNILQLKINLRVPVNTSLDTIIEKYNNLKQNIETLTVTPLSKQHSLYVSKDSYLVQTLTDIFNKKTNQNASPIAIGGGTFARAFPNCVAFGANMPGNKDMCHQVNEFIDIDTLILSTKIYAEAIYELAK